MFEVSCGLSILFLDYTCWFTMTDDRIEVGVICYPFSIVFHVQIMPVVKVISRSYFGRLILLAVVALMGIVKREKAMINVKFKRFLSRKQGKSRLIYVWTAHVSMSACFENMVGCFDRLVLLGTLSLGR